MKDKLFSAVCVLLVFTLLTISVFAVNNTDTVNDTGHDIKDDVEDIVDGIVNWNLIRTESADIQSWIDGELTANAGIASEWYIFTLSQSGIYDFTAYKAALEDYLESNAIRSASSRLKYALILDAIENGNDIGSTNAYVAKTLNDSIGQQGIMSWIYGLHVMNNGIVCDAYTTEDVIGILLELQHEDGGWSLTGEYGDVDVTAMTVQALAPYYQISTDVKDAVENALTLLSARQREDGGYASYGVSNPDSAAQVLVALSSLGIDCTEDARFIKNEKTLFDGIWKYRLSDGSFCHKEGDISNDTATVQVYYSMISYLRMTEGKSPLYILDADSSDTELSEEIEAETDSAASEPAESVSNILPSDEISEASGEKADYKPFACLVILCVGGVVCLIFFLLGKRNPKNFIAIAILTGFASVIILATDFESADDYYSGSSAVKENVIGDVTLTIRCDTVVGKSDSEYIPADGIILDLTEFAIEEGDSVYDILTEAAQKYHIQIEYAGQGDMIYINGIQYLYEFDFGDLSGWIYHVNGDVPSVGCGEYILSDGDEIEWLYSCDLGSDLK